jgi:hypothetical protein
MKRALFITWLAVSACYAADFTIVHLGDPHIDGDHATPKTAASQLSLIVANKGAWNIQLVVPIGDFNTYGYGISAWDDVWTTYFQQIDNAGIPLLAAIGNHDYDSDNGNGGPSQRAAKDDTHNFDAALGYGRFYGKPYFNDPSLVWTDPMGGRANFAYKLTIEGYKFLVISLETFPRGAAVTWAKNLITANPDYWVIIATHAYLDKNGSRITDAQQWGPEAYSLSHNPVDANGMPANLSGADLWTYLIEPMKNIRMVLCGHWADSIWSQGEQTVTATRSDGSKVYEHLNDFQNYNVSWATYMKFRPSLNKVEVSTVKPDGTLDETYNPTYQLDWDFNLPNVNLVWEGSSTTYGSGVTATERFSALVPLLITGATVYSTNIAAGGEILGDYASCPSSSLMMCQYATQAAPHLNEHVGMNVLWLQNATNDLCFASSTVDGATGYARVLDYLSRAGTSWEKITMTQTPRNLVSGTDTATCESRRVDYNSRVMAGCLSPTRIYYDAVNLGAVQKCAEGSPYNYVVDVAADTRLGCSGCQNNAMYYGDGTHGTPLWHQIVATMAAAAVQDVVTPTQFEPAGPHAPHTRGGAVLQGPGRVK